jgi:citrate lyase subunit beta/citryl-CoA lyase
VASGHSQPGRRPPALRRSWLFVSGTDAASHAAALASGSDVIVPDLEDFTVPAHRPHAREVIPRLLAACRARGIVAAVRINPLAGDGLADLAAVMRGQPDCVFLPKTAGPAHVAALDDAIGAFERELGIPAGSTEIVPNVETAAGLIHTFAIARGSPRVSACLVASEDMATSLGAERSREATELAYVRQRFLVECVAAGVVAVDCPYTFSDVQGARTDTLWARKMGYKAKSLVLAGHAGAINVALTPSESEVAQARRIVAAFDAARAAGSDVVEVNGTMVEVPTWLNARRLLERYEALQAFERG